MIIEIFNWLWLAILLGAAGALRATAPRRLGAAWHASLAVDATILAVIAELIWRVLAPGNVAPLASWAAALFFLSVALSALERNRRSEDRAREAEDAEDGASDPVEPYPEDPFHDLSGAPGRTERAADSPVRSGEDRIRLWAEQTTEAVAVLDLGGEVEWVNPAWARLHGYRTSEALGRHLSLFFTPGETRDRILPGLEEARKTGSWKGEVEHRRKDGSALVARLSLSSLHDGGPVGYVAVAAAWRDQALPKVEPEKTAPAAEQDSESLRVLAGGVAHELNNLLTGILGNASLLSQHSPPEITAEIQDIETASRRASELSRLLQAYSGHVHPTSESLDLTELVRSSAAAIERAGGNRSTFSLELAADLPPVSVDPEQVLLLARNLLANARDAGGADGCEIVLRTGSAILGKEDIDDVLTKGPRAPGPYAFLEIEDTGHGMEEVTRSRMFEPFYTTRPERRGLGLTVAAGIARGHRGGIEVESAPGIGTRVRAYFPAGHVGRRRSASRQTARRPSGRASRSAGRAPETAAGGGTILVIDNEKIIRDLATGILEKQGFSVLAAADGGPALALYRRHRGVIRAVLLDLSMPLMSGDDLYRELVSIDPGVRVILMTGHDAEEVRKSFPGELAGILQKPFKPEDLLAALRGALR